MLVIGILAVINLASSDTIADSGAGIVVGIIWIIQSIMTLVYIDNVEKGL